MPLFTKAKNGHKNTCILLCFCFLVPSILFAQESKNNYSEFLQWWDNRCKGFYYEYSNVKIPSKYKVITQEFKELPKYEGPTIILPEHLRNSQIPTHWNHQYWKDPSAKTLSLYESADLSILVFVTIDTFEKIQPEQDTAYGILHGHDTRYVILGNKTYLSVSPYNTFEPVPISLYYDDGSEECLGGTFELFWIEHSTYPIISVLSPCMNGATVCLYVYNKNERAYKLERNNSVSY